MPEMKGPWRIRVETSSDGPAVLSVVEQAFGSPVEAELVRLIRASSGFVRELSLVAEEAGRIVGHVMLSSIELHEDDVTHGVLSLSPLSVHPERQRHGIGSALVRAVLQRADERGEPLVCLEGDPRYYGRLGFRDARAFGIRFDLPDWAPPEAGQVYPLRVYDPSIRGRVVYPPAFAAADELRARLEP